MENNDSGILIVVYVVDLNLLMGRYFFFFYCAWKFQAGRRTGRTIRPAAPERERLTKSSANINLLYYVCINIT